MPESFISRLAHKDSVEDIQNFNFLTRRHPHVDKSEIRHRYHEFKEKLLENATIFTYVGLLTRGLTDKYFQKL